MLRNTPRAYLLNQIKQVQNSLTLQYLYWLSTVLIRRYVFCESDMYLFLHKKVFNASCYTRLHLASCPRLPAPALEIINNLK